MSDALITAKNRQWVIVPAQGPEQLALVRELFLEYAQSLGIDLCFQNFERELAELPGAYEPPEGRLLLAMDRLVVAGCVALRNLGDRNCEMKRLYVRPAHRAQGVGGKLARAVIAEATAEGYERMRLDTLESLEAALRLYQSLGFRPIDPYYNNPHGGTVFLELGLR
jgi:putative acetyltransferase